ncbi:MAG: LD-carboxypeptidase [Pirellula sp.]
MSMFPSNRRDFVSAVGGCGALAAISSFGSSQADAASLAQANNALRAPTLPRALRPGMKLGIPAPAGGVSKEDLETKLRAFEQAMKLLGLEIVVAKSVLAGAHGAASFLAAPDEVRAAEFMEFVNRPDIDGIVCMRGGYGVMRILPLLDFDAIQKNPKVISGYSDITALVNAIYQRCNLVAFHGPIAAASLDEFTQKWFLPMVYTTPPQTPVQKVVYEDDKGLVTLVSGKANGRIVGGNLTLIASTMGTPFEINTQGAVLFLEDVGEKAYRVDRMLTQLWLAGKLQSCAAIVLGQFTETDDSTGSTNVESVLKSRLASLNIPVLANFPVGHVKEKFTMPIGAMADVDSTNKRFSILEPTVRE